MAYATGKYANQPQGVMINEGKVYWMETGVESVDKEHKAFVDIYTFSD